MRMKSMLLALYFTTLSAVPVLAEVRPGAITATFAAGGYSFDSQQDMKSSLLYGARLGYNLTRNWGLEGSFTFTQLNPSDSRLDGKGEQYQTSGNILCHFLPERQIVPFITLGGGWSRTTEFFGDPNNDDALLNFGGGLKYFISDNVALRADFRNIYSYHSSQNGNGNNWSNYEYTAGFSFQLGGTKATPPASASETTAEPAAAATVSATPVMAKTAAPEPDRAKPVPLMQEQTSPAVSAAKTGETTAQPPAPVTAEPVSPAKQAPALTPQPVPVSQSCKGITVRDVMILKNGLEIITDSPVEKFYSFNLSKPTRLVIDISSCADEAHGSKSLKFVVNKMAISTVRVGSHPGTLRITLDSPQNRFPDYHIEKSQRGLQIISKNKTRNNKR